MKSFPFVLHGHVDHDEAEFGDGIIVVGHTDGAQKMDPGLVQNAKHGVVAHVPAVVEVGDADGNFGYEREGIGQGYFYAGHGVSLQ